MTPVGNAKVIPVTTKSFEPSFTTDGLALVTLNKHLLDQINEMYVHEPDDDTSFAPVASTGLTADNKITLGVNISVSALDKISPIEESYRIAYRMFLCWEVADLGEYGLDHLAAKARGTTERYSLNRAEVDEFCEKYNVPAVSIFNITEGGAEGDVDIRIYGGFKNKTMVMWNCGYRCICREIFELQAFPFDSNELSLQLRLNSPLTWDLFDLTVQVVQFNKACLYQTEYNIAEPTIKRNSPAHKSTDIHFRATRLAQYYVQNIVVMMFSLSLLGLLAFIMEVQDLGDRVSTVLTVILTAVAFKFVIDGSLPKVPYNTVIDYYILSSSLSLAAMALVCVIPSFNFWGDDDTRNEVNQYLGICSACFIVIELIVWWVWARRMAAVDNKTQIIKALDGKNWYAYRFATAPFHKSA